MWSKVEMLATLEGSQVTPPWIWYPFLNAPAEQAAGRQRGKMWKRVTPGQARQGLCLMGQLLPLYALETAEETTSWWARSNDITYIGKFPVALGFFLPPDPIFDSSASFIRTGQIRPPALIGEVGIVWSARIPSVYPVALLPEEGQQLCDSIRESLDGFFAGSVSFERWLPVSEQVQEHVQRLVSLYWQLHQSRRPAQQTLPGLQNVFEGGKTHVAFPAAVPVEAVLAAYSNADSTKSRWTQSGPFPQYRFDYGDGMALVEVRTSARRLGQKVDETTSRSLWQRVSKLSDLDGDVLIAALAHYMGLSAASLDEEGYGVITGAQILDYRGIEPIMKRDAGSSVKRRAGHRQEDLAGTALCFDRVVDTWVTIKRRKGFSLESPLLQVKQVIRRHPKEGDNELVEEFLLEGESLQALITEAQAEEAEDQSFVVLWLYRPGTWFKQGVAHSRSIAFLCRKALTYNLEKEFWERRLVRYFLFQLRLSALAGGSITRQISTFFNELSLPVNERDPQKTRNRFEKAMNRLVDDHQIAAWGPVEGNPPLPRTDWLPIWLSWRIVVTVAPLIALRPEFSQELKRLVAHGLGLSVEALHQSLADTPTMAVLAEQQRISLSQLHALELRAFRQVSEKAVTVGDTTQEIVDEAARHFKREPEMLNQFVIRLFAAGEPLSVEEGI